MLSGCSYRGVLKLGSLSLELVLRGFMVPVIVTAVLDWNQVVVMLFWEHFTVCHRLYAGVVMVNVGFLIQCYLSFLPPLLINGLVGYTWSDPLMHLCIMMSGFGHEVADSCLSLVHGVIIFGFNGVSDGMRWE